MLSLILFLLMLVQIGGEEYFKQPETISDFGEVTNGLLCLLRLCLLSHVSSAILIVALSILKTML